MIKVTDFCKTYAKKTAVQGVSLQVPKGQIYGLIGPDGAGKSSLLKAIAGVMTYNNGEVWVDDILVDSEASAEKIKGRLGFMPQGLGLNLYPELSVAENIQFFGELRGVPAKELDERKARLLEMTQLTQFVDRPMKFLSGGMKQKLGLICTLIHRPPLVILDEPTTGVDPLSRRDFWTILNQLVKEERITALVSTAYMDEASRFQQLSILHQGQVIAQGSAQAILKQHPGFAIEFQVDESSHQITQTLNAIACQFARFERLGSVWRGVCFHAQADALRQEITHMLSTFQHLPSWQFVPLTLEDVFVELLTPQSDKVKKAKKVKGLTEQVRLPSATSSLSNPQVLIKVSELSKHFKEFVAADQVSFEVKAGEILGLLGANGAGKSTVIKMITGILPATSGDAEVAGLSMRTSAQAIKQQIGYMSQSFSLYLDLTVLENIQLFGRIYGLGSKALKQRCDWVLNMAQLQKVQDDLVKDLPLGQRQRLALGCALIHEPKVLFLDEPTSGVDPLGRANFWRILVDLAEQMQVAILITTHYMSEAEHCHQLVLMQAGRVVAHDFPRNLKQALATERHQTHLPSLEEVFIAQLESHHASV
ncbi:ATP-binding cassette domain-containing protein [Thiosulfativibrio zosterae]|uniref:Multidrug ABC transporter ATP-binding protein n=1 Tax=Thiosulfativibrio zosterae TaxID=2675053 RepID=A0A6F8PK61_9GAMM|nr:ATP-binding cassette domain-containing protein [Thiosulfativibrio zosterae]BBP42485.1 multidrug ABC transporter ATP-binding protein [Thiosulfativibrio zosterae]